MFDEDEYTTNILFIKLQTLNPLLADKKKMGSKKGYPILEYGKSFTRKKIIHFVTLDEIYPLQTIQKFENC